MNHWTQRYLRIAGMGPEVLEKARQSTLRFKQEELVRLAQEKQIPAVSDKDAQSEKDKERRLLVLAECTKSHHNQKPAENVKFALLRMQNSAYIQAAPDFLPDKDCDFEVGELYEVIGKHTELSDIPLIATDIPWKQTESSD